MISGQNEIIQQLCVISGQSEIIQQLCVCLYDSKCRGAGVGSETLQLTLCVKLQKTSLFEG